MGMCMSKTGLFANPDVKVVDCDVKSAGLSGITLEVKLLVANPNPATLQVVRIIYDLKKGSDGAVLADGVSRQQATLKAADTTEVRVPMSFKYWGLGAAGKSIVTRGKTTIVVKGEMTFKAPMAPGGTATSPFEDTVEVAMENLMGS